MLENFTLIARNEAANKWLNENPLVLGLLAIALGAWLGFAGFVEYQRGVAHDKYGNEIPGKLGTGASVLRMTIGAAAICFGLYKMVMGAI